MIRRKNALSMLCKLYPAWSSEAFYSSPRIQLVFGPSHGGLIGTELRLFSGVSPVNVYVLTSIPGLLYVSFQMMFAVMVPVIVTGAWAEKMTFKASLPSAYCGLSSSTIRLPIGSGIPMAGLWPLENGFAGSLTIHTSSGTAAFVAEPIFNERSLVRDHSTITCL